MAQCNKCKANVGCGCNLKEGLCSYCHAEIKKALVVNPPKPVEQNAESTIDQLSRVW